MSHPNANAEDRDRLGMALLLAVVVHVLLLLGIGLSWDPPPEPKTTSLAVTLARDEAETPPEEADFAADADQQGGGPAEQAQPPTPPAANPVPPLPTPAERGPSAAAEDRAEALIDSETADTETPPEPEEATDATSPSLDEALDDHREAAAAEAIQLQRRLRQPQAPEKRFLNARTRAHEAAAYMERWVRQIETVGNLNYPSAARERGLSGQLILEATLRPDGSVEQVRIVEPSRHRLLDEAAVRIVRLSAPFPEIPDEVLEGRDRLVITRTWAFEDGERVQAR